MPQIYWNKNLKKKQKTLYTLGQEKKNHGVEFTWTYVYANGIGLLLILDSSSAWSEVVSVNDRKMSTLKHIKNDFFRRMVFWVCL